jgi:hypothetical protein
MNNASKLHSTPVGFKAVDEKFVEALVSGAPCALTPEQKEERRQAACELGKEILEQRERIRRREWEEQIQKENAAEAKRIVEQEKQKRREKALTESEAKQRRKAEALEIDKQKGNDFSIQTANSVSKREQELVDRAAESSALILAEITKFRSYFFAIPEPRRNEISLDILIAAAESLKKLI